MAMLDPRKLARILANRDRVRAGRATPLTLVYNRPEGTTYQTINVVWHYEDYSEPQAEATGAAITNIEARAELPLTLDPTQISFLAETDTPTSAAVAAAHAWEILTYRKAGIVPNRWTCHLRRLR